MAGPAQSSAGTFFPILLPHFFFLVADDEAIRKFFTVQKYSVQLLFFIQCEHFYDEYKYRFFFDRKISQRQSLSFKPSFGVFPDFGMCCRQKQCDWLAEAIFCFFFLYEGHVVFFLAIVFQPIADWQYPPYIHSPENPE